MKQDQKQLLVHFNQDASFLQTVPEPTTMMLHRSVAWGSMGVRHFNVLPMETFEHQPLEHAVMIHLRDEPALKRSIGEHFQQANILAGDIFIVPAHINHAVVHTHESEELLVTLNPSFFTQSADEFTNGDRLELLPTFAQSDPLIYSIGRSLKSALELPQQGDRLYIDALTTTLSLHLLRNYCSRSPRLQSYNDGLPRYKLNLVLDYIRAHLHEDIQLTNLAAIAGISQYYFLRLFKRSTGITPHRYLQQQRLEQAKVLLKQRQMTIADIALECGFANQTHFTKSFRQSTGVTPKTYQQQ